MTRSVRMVFLAIVSAAAALFSVTSVMTGAQSREFKPVTDDMLRKPSPNDWLAWRGTSMSLGYSALDQINRSNVGQLQLAWSWAMDPGIQESAPIVYDGVMYVSGPGGIAQALDAASGDLLWEYRYEVPGAKVTRAGANRGMAIYDDKVFLNTPDAHVVALDARTGKVVWNTLVQEGFSFGVGAIVARGKVVSGLMSCSRFVEKKCAIVALDAKTGKEVWRFNTIALPGDPGDKSWGTVEPLYRAGTEMWVAGSYDPDLNLIYWATSQAKPFAQFARGTDGAALYSNTILALNADTGKLVWHYQATPGETHDLDDAFENVLVDYGSRKSLFEMGKLGILWELDRATGKVLNARDFGYQNVLDLDPKTFTVKYKPEMLPQPNVALKMCPSTGGVKNWPSMAWSPETQALYIPLQMVCNAQTYVDVEKKPGGGGGGAGGGRLGQNAYLNPKSDGKNMAEFVAVTPSGTTLWKKAQPAPFTTGALTTAGGLVFEGDWARYISAFDVKTGALLWQTRAPSSPEGFAMTYAVRGRQYIAVPVGCCSGGSIVGTAPSQLAAGLKAAPPGNSMMVFALPQAQTAKPAR